MNARPLIFLAFLVNRLPPGPDQSVDGIHRAKTQNQPTKQNGDSLVLNRTNLLAIAAVATLSVAALSTDASARGFGGGMGGGSHAVGGGHAVSGGHGNLGHINPGVLHKPG